MISLAQGALNAARELLGIKKGIEDAYVHTIRDIGESLVFYTPFRTGLASSNWNVSGNGNTSPERPVVEGIKGESSIQAIAAQSLGLKLGVTATFSNPVHYIDDLERGTSRQARGGMVTPTISRVNDLWLLNLEKQKII